MTIGTNILTVLLEVKIMKYELLAIYFDLSGVLLDFRGPEYIQRLSRRSISRSKFDEFWSKNIGAINFTKGLCSEVEFAEEAIKFFNLSVSEKELIENYRSWYNGPYPGSLELLNNLKNRIKIGCLSNTNFIDVPIFRKELKIGDIFDVCVFSCEYKMIKPQKDIYVKAVEVINVPAENILFLDDSLDNINSAIEVGMKAELCNGIGEVKRILTRYHLL